MSGASERANGRASGPVLQSVFFVVLAHSDAQITAPFWLTGEELEFRDAETGIIAILHANGRRLLNYQALRICVNEAET